MKSLTFLSIMPPERSKKTRSRLDLYAQASRGIKMSPCTRCQKKGTKCYVTSSSLRCAKCIKAGGGVKCNVYGPLPSEWALLDREESKLDASLRKTQEEQQQLFSHLAELQAKILRLNKQREMFRARAAEMLRRGLKSLDELDAVEEAERLAEVQTPVETDPPTSEAPDPYDSLDPELAAALAAYDPSDPLWASLDFGDEMPQAIPGT